MPVASVPRVQPVAGSTQAGRLAAGLPLLFVVGAPAAMTAVATIWNGCPALWTLPPDTAVSACVRETPALTLSASLTATLPKPAGRMAKLSVEQATIVGTPLAGYVMRMRALGQALGSTIPANVLRPASPAENVSVPRLRIRP